MIWSVSALEEHIEGHFKTACAMGFGVVVDRVVLVGAGSVRLSLGESGFEDLDLVVVDRVDAGFSTFGIPHHVVLDFRERAANAALFIQILFDEGVFDYKTGSQCEQGQKTDEC